MSDDMERYGFTWPGKSEAVLEAGRPVDKMLRPCVDESVNFGSTENLYIEGDNLEALKVIQKSYARKVKMIYIDPPYNTGHDFIYNDTFTQTEEEARSQFGLYDYIEEIQNFTLKHYRENTRSNPRYHSDWCSMMYPRLKVAHSLLTRDGVMFISIDDNEQARLRMMCDEIFGENNFVAQLTWRRRSGANDAINNVSMDHEYIICYSRSTGARLNGTLKTFDNYSNPDNDPRGEWARDNLTCGKTASQRPNLFYPITDPATGRVYECNPDHVWRFDRRRMQELIETGKVIFPADGEGVPAYKRHKSEVRSETKPYSSIIDTSLNSSATRELRDILGGQFFDYPKPVDLIEQLILQATDKDSIVLDFFAGSSTTAHAVMNLNAHDLGHRKFIMIQLPEECSPESEAHKAGYATICDIGRERIKRAGNGLIGDTGFRVLKLDSTNYTDVYLLHDELSPDRLDSLTDNLKPDRSPLDLLFGLIADEGLPLSLPYRTEYINGYTVHHYGEGEIIACFDYNLTEDIITHIAQLAPVRAVFRDSGFTTTQDRINLEQLFSYYAPESELMVI